MCPFPACKGSHIHCHLVYSGLPQRRGAEWVPSWLWITARKWERQDHCPVTRTRTLQLLSLDSGKRGHVCPEPTSSSRPHSVSLEFPNRWSRALLGPMSARICPCGARPPVWVHLVQGQHFAGSEQILDPRAAGWTQSQGCGWGQCRGWSEGQHPLQ